MKAIKMGRGSSKLSMVVMAAALLCLPLLLTECKKREAAPPQGIITYSVGTVLIDQVPVGAGDAVTLNKTLVTENKSMCVIQFGDTAVLTVKANTRIKLAGIDKGANGVLSIGFSQQQGTTFHKVLRKGTPYTVGTPTMVAAVRGTSFLVDVGDKKTKTLVLKGTVSVARPGDDKPENAVMTGVGREVEVSEAGKISAPAEIPAAETKVLATLDSIRTVESVESPQTIARLKTAPVSETAAVIPEEARREIVPPRPTLEDIRKEHGGVSQVVTVDGREFIGAFRQEGGWMDIITVERTYRLPMKDIKRVGNYTGPR